MERNNIIHLAKWLVRFSMALLILVVASVAFITIHKSIYPESYRNWYLQDAYFPAGLTTISVTFNQGSSDLSLGDISNGWMIWFLIRTSIISFLVFSILRRVSEVLDSINNLQTFYGNNIKSLRSIALTALILAAVASFNFGNVHGSFMFNFTIPFGPILFSAASLVISEIFREGKILSDDSNSIV